MRITHGTVLTGTNNPNRQASVNAWNESHRVLGATSRSVMAAMSTVASQLCQLTEPGREGMFAFSTADLSAKVAADLHQGIYVAPASAPTGASGAWVRQFIGAADPMWFGLVRTTGSYNATNGTANSAAMLAMFATLRLHTVNSGNASQKHAGHIMFPAGTFDFASTIDLTDGTWKFQGAGTGKTAAANGTRLRFPTGVTGVRVQRYDTTEATDTRAIGFGADNSLIQGFDLEGPYGSVVADNHGINLRAAASVIDCAVFGFEGDGIFSRCSAEGFPVGNSNGAVITNVTAQACRNGLYVDSADANAWVITMFNGSGNRQWGVWDSSFLGNTYVACHTSLNGWHAWSTRTCVSMNGNRYYVRNGQAAGASTNPPTGTTAFNQWWGYIGPGGTGIGLDEWVSGTTYVEGGAYKFDTGAAYNVLLGCYSEGDQNPSQLDDGATLVLGGLHGAQIHGNGQLYGGVVNANGNGMFLVQDLSIGRNFTMSGSFLNAPNAVITGAYVTGNIVGTNGSRFGPTGGPAVDHGMTFDTTNNTNTLTFRSWSGGVSQDDGYFQSQRNNGLNLNGSVRIALRAAGSDVAIVSSTGVTVTGFVKVTDEAYGAGWNGSVEVPTKNAVYDKIESLVVGGGGVSSFNTRTGAITLSSSDVTTALTFTPANASHSHGIADITSIPTGTVFYRKTSGTGAAETQTLATLKTDLGLTGTNSGDQTITLSGDVSGSGTAGITATLATVNSDVGSFGSATAIPVVTVDGKGRITAISTSALASYQPLDADLTSIAALTTTTYGRGLLTLADAAAFTAGANTFTSSLKGLAPASGGGTANFLRADGSWAAPTATAAAGGADRSVQFNNSTAIAGADRVDIDASGNLRLDHSGTSTIPGADQTALIPQRMGAGGGRLMPRWRMEDGTFCTLQASIARNSVYHAQAIGNATTSLAPMGGGAPTNVGTATARAVATTNRTTRARRLGYVSVATAGGTAGIYNGSAALTQWTIGDAGTPAAGGFLGIFRWATADAATVAGAHMFVGMRAATGAPVAATSPATLPNLVGVAQVNGSANLQIVYGGSAAQSAIDLGSSFPAASSSVTNGSLYELMLYARPDQNNSVAYRVENISTGAVAEGVLTGTAGTALPASTTLLGMAMWRSNNATALAVGIDIVGCYVESDI